MAGAWKLNNWQFKERDDGLWDLEVGLAAPDHARDGARPDWLAALDAPPRAEEFELTFDSDLSEMLRARIVGPRRSRKRPPTA